MGVREAAKDGAGRRTGARRSIADETRALRSRWRTATMAAGWAFPADWPLAEVDEVCTAVLGARKPRAQAPGAAVLGVEAPGSEDPGAAVLGAQAPGAENPGAENPGAENPGAENLSAEDPGAEDPGAALYRLGAARAQSGAGLAETVLDLAALHAVLAEPPGSTGIVSPNVDAIPSRMLRSAALGWGDVMSRRAADCSADDPLTGLATGAYLRTRLREVYAETRASGRDDYALVLVGLDLSRTSGWSRVVAMTLLADALREVFDSGETIASLGPSVAAVLLRRDERLHRAVVNLRVLTADRLAVDPHVAPTGPAKVWLEPLPPTYEEAAELLSHVGR